MKKGFDAIMGDIFGGFASMLVALPSAIAFGLIIFSPLGADFASKGAIAGIIGTIVIGIIAPLFGGTARLISAPCAPAAAVLSAFVIEILNNNGKSIISTESIPSLILVIILACGIIQIIIGIIGGGRFIKYIPYPVVAGYLSGVGLLIIIGQTSKLLGTGSDLSFFKSIINPDMWEWKGLIVGIIAMLGMFLFPKITKKVPATIVALLLGIGVYGLFSLFFPSLTSLTNNKMVIGDIGGSEASIFTSISDSWGGVFNINMAAISKAVVTAITLSILLSIDTLKTCLIVDALTRSRHNSNKELIGQGLANVASGVACGIPGAGTMGATLVNITSGANTKRSGVFEGLFVLLVLLVMSPYIAWVPVAALAGILITIGIRMIDVHIFQLLKHKSTVFDFIVFLMVILTALIFSLIAAAGVGILLSIFLFLRDQVRQSVLRRKVFGNQLFSKKRRLPEEREILLSKGNDILIVELQGPLFFGTADQLFTLLEPHLTTSKYIILDMRRVHSVDYTAVHRLEQIQQTIDDANGVFILTSVPLYLPTGQNVLDYLKQLGFSHKVKNIRFYNDLDKGIQWAEDQILKEANLGLESSDKTLSLSEISMFSGFGNDMLELLKSCVIEKKFEKGNIIFSKGDTGNEIYFIRKGSVHIHLPLNTGMFEHLATFGSGDFFGDMSFLTNNTRSAFAIAEDEVSLYIFTRSAFDEIVEKYPRLGELFFLRLATGLADRLGQTHVMLKALADY